MEGSYAGRAGEKLAHALDHFGVAVAGRVCADFGCAVGGFTDCLLRHGAARVYAVDTAYGTLDWRLRNDPRVVAMERTNAMHVELPERVDAIAIDVGWTRQEKILPRALACLAPGGSILSLLKPQYECEEGERTGGVVKEGLVETVVQRVVERLGGRDIAVSGTVESPLVGGKGANREFFIWISPPAPMR